MIQHIARTPWVVDMNAPAHKESSWLFVFELELTWGSHAHSKEPATCNQGSDPELFQGQMSSPAILLAQEPFFFLSHPRSRNKVAIHQFTRSSASKSVSFQVNLVACLAVMSGGHTPTRGFYYQTWAILITLNQHSKLSPKQSPSCFTFRGPLFLSYDLLIDIVASPGAIIVGPPSAWAPASG